MVKHLAMFGIFDIDTYNIGTSQGLRCSGHLRCSNFARKSNFAKLAMFDFKRTIAKKAELRKIPRPSRSSNLRKGFLHLPACQSLSLWERCLRSRRRGQGRHERAAAQRWAGSLSERYYRSVRAVWQHPCPLRRSAPAPPKGEPLAYREASPLRQRLPY